MDGSEMSSQLHRSFDEFPAGKYVLCFGKATNFLFVNTEDTKRTWKCLCGEDGITWKMQNYTHTNIIFLSLPETFTEYACFASVVQKLPEISLVLVAGTAPAYHQTVIDMLGETNLKYVLVLHIFWGTEHQNPFWIETYEPNDITFCSNMDALLGEITRKIAHNDSHLALPKEPFLGDTRFQQPLTPQAGQEDSSSLVKQSDTTLIGETTESTEETATSAKNMALSSVCALIALFSMALLPSFFGGMDRKMVAVRKMVALIRRMVALIRGDTISSTGGETATSSGEGLPTAGTTVSSGGVEPTISTGGMCASTTKIIALSGFVAGIVLILKHACSLIRFATEKLKELLNSFLVLGIAIVMLVLVMIFSPLSTCKITGAGLAATAMAATAALTTMSEDDEEVVTALKSVVSLLREREIIKLLKALWSLPDVLNPLCKAISYECVKFTAGTSISAFVAAALTALVNVDTVGETMCTLSLVMAAVLTAVVQKGVGVMALAMGAALVMGAGLTLVAGPLGTALGTALASVGGIAVGAKFKEREKTNQKNE